MKVFLITGASTGIGEVTARRAVEAGYKVVVAARSGDKLAALAEELGGPVWVVKAQIHAGGRGKGGGVKVVKSIEDVRKEADNILGMQLITP